MIEAIILGFALYGLGLCTGYVAGLFAPKKIPKEERKDSNGHSC